MRIYLSGKITGLDPKVAKENFEWAESTCQMAGFEPVNPLKILPYNVETTWEQYMLADIKELFECEAIYMILGWETSRGARIERAIAMEMKKKIYYQENE